MKLKFLVISFLFLGLVSCSHHHGAKPESNVMIGKQLNANKYGNIYFSGQPKMEDQESLVQDKFKTIINLRSPSEYDEESERRFFQEQGLNYYNIPFGKTDPISESKNDQVFKAIKKHRSEGKILVHCSSGNRVGLWIGAHFHKDHGYSKSDSLDVAKKLGLNKPKAIKKLEVYLQKAAE